MHQPAVTPIPALIKRNTAFFAVSQSFTGAASPFWRQLECVRGQRRTRPGPRDQALAAFGSFAAVAAGLTSGEGVIVYPSDRVAPGVRVEAH